MGGLDLAVQRVERAWLAGRRARHPFLQQWRPALDGHQPGRQAGARTTVHGATPRVALRRLAEAGVSLDDPDFGVVLAAAGSQQAPANAAVAT